MSEISRIYDNPIAIAAAKRSRELQAKRDKKRAARRGKRDLQRIRSGKRLRKDGTFRERDAFGRPMYAPGMGKEFYKTKAWIDMRYSVLQKRGAVCECCGATKADDVRIHVDHIRPRHRFPLLELVESNLQVLCEPCNQGKGSRDETDWRSGGGITHPYLKATGS